MTEVSIFLTAPSVEVPQWAGRLGGICTEEHENIAGIEQVFRFNMESFANQFSASVFHYPEIISVGRSPNQVQKAIADSKLCDCGWTTKQQCDLECEAMIDQQIELAQEFPTLGRVRGDRDE